VSRELWPRTLSHHHSQAVESRIPRFSEHCLMLAQAEVIANARYARYGLHRRETQGRYLARGGTS
jgi:hypothetical protein